MKRDYVFTYFTEFTVLACSLYMYRLVAQNLGELGFAKYLLITRAVSMLFPLFLCGMGVGVPRYVAIAEAATPTRADANYLLVGAAVIAGLLICSMPIMFFLGRSIAFLLLGNPDLTPLLWVGAVYMIGQLAHGLTYSYFRGRLWMFHANGLQILNTCLIPVFLAFKCAQPSSLLLAIGALNFLGALALILPVLFDLKINKVFLKNDAVSLIKYGSLRIPGDFAMAAIYGIPVSIAAHTGGVVAGGEMAFAISILTKVAYLFTPIGVILLPESSRWIAQRKINVLKTRTSWLLVISMLLTTLLVGLFALFGRSAIAWYLGENYAVMATPTLSVLLGSWPLVAFCNLRSIIDAYYEKPLNAINLSAALMILLCITAIFRHNASYYMPYALFCALMVLAALSGISAAAMFRKLSAVEGQGFPATKQQLQ